MVTDRAKEALAFLRVHDRRFFEVGSLVCELSGVHNSDATEHVLLVLVETLSHKDGSRGHRAHNLLSTQMTEYVSADEKHAWACTHKIAMRAA
jgi:hypothetical protein